MSKEETMVGRCARAVQATISELTSDTDSFEYICGTGRLASEEIALAVIDALMDDDLHRLLRDRKFTGLVGAADANGCRPWLGNFDKRDGYGFFNNGNGSRGAHRYAYEMANGPIPAGLVIDHVCRNRACVNPLHLRAVTNAENVLSGEGRTARNAAKTECPRGHPLSGGNLYVNPQGGRMCRACMKISRDASRAKRRAMLSQAKEQGK